MNTKDILLETKDLYKIYQGRPVIRNVNVTVHRGECVVISGGNGSGKSTLIQLLTGILTPSNGSVSLKCNLAMQYAPAVLDGSLRLTAWEFLFHMARIDGCSFLEAKTLCRKMFDHYRMTGLEKIGVNQLSEANRRKLILCQALLKQCDLLVMDEPLLGLDRYTQQIFYQDIAKIKDQNTAILITSHSEDMSDTKQTIADRIWYLVHGMVKEEYNESVVTI